MQAREPCASGSCYLPNPDDFQERRICGVHSPRARKAADATILEDWRQDVSACAASRSEEHGRASAGAELRRCRTEGGQWRGGGEAEYFDPASILSTGKSESKRC